MSDLEGMLATANQSILSGNPEDAIGTLTQVIEADYKPVVALRLRGLAYLELDELNKARKDFEAAIPIDETPYDFHAMICYVAYLMGDNDTALDHFQMAVKIEKKLPLAYAIAGLIHKQKGDPENLQAKGLYRDGVKFFIRIVPKESRTMWDWLGAIVAERELDELDIDHRRKDEDEAKKYLRPEQFGQLNRQLERLYQTQP